jgi:predicted NBD/HSP70 family sugar kinase
VKFLEAYKSFEVLNDRSKYIFDIVQKNGPITKSELIGITKTKLTTLNRDIQILLDKKIIIETDIGESTGGRKPSLYDVNSSGFYIIGIDISRIYTRIVITNLKLKIIGEELLNHEYKIENINDIIPDSVKNLCIKLELEKSMIVGVGIGIVSGFDTKPLYDALSAELDVKIFIDNGASVAVIGEYFFGIGKGMKNIAYINCGVGIRTGIISEGVLIPSINNSEDAFGHMIVDANGELCSCGNYGCIESYVSIINITKKFVEEINENKMLYTNKEVDNIDYKDVCNLAERKNEVAINIIKKSALYFGIALSNYMKLFNPQLIILSGPLMQNSKLFYDICKEVTLEKCHIKNTNIQFSNGGYYKDKSIAMGACAMVIQKIKN